MSSGLIFYEASSDLNWFILLDANNSLITSDFNSIFFAMLIYYKFVQVRSKNMPDNRQSIKKNEN